MESPAVTWWLFPQQVSLLNTVGLLGSHRAFWGWSLVRSEKRAVSLCFPLLSSSFSVVSYLMRSATCPVMMFQPSSLSTRLYRILVCNFQNWAQTNLFSLPGNNCRHRVSLQWQDADQYKDLLWVSLATIASHAPVRSPQLSGIVKALSVWLEKNLLVLQFTDWEWWE